MMKVKPSEIKPTDMISILNFRARKLKTVLEDHEVVELLKQSKHINYTIQEVNEVINNLIFASRKEQNA